jgi:acyl-CoA reductase-like NAD-dependent aldehyde dehydrogenase
MATAAVVPLVINGQDHYPDRTFDVKSPSTGQVVHKCGAASAADATRAVDVASEALKSWRKTTPQDRRDIFLKAGEIMQSRRDELAKYMSDETGAAQDWAAFNIDTAIGILKDVAGRIPTLEGSFPATMNPSRSAIILREPYGVVLSIAPWYESFA